VQDLIALDLPQDDAVASVIEDIWEDGDAVCILDHRLAGPARQRALAALAPTVLIDRSGRHRLPGGTPVESGDALVILTSGSMASPKAAVHTVDSLTASAAMTSARLGVNPVTSQWLCCLPIVHIGGFSVISRSLLTSTPLQVRAHSDPSVLEEAASSGVTHVSLVTAMLQRIDPSIFDCIVLGAAAPPTDLPSNVVTTYGLTETGSGVVYSGLPLDGVDLAIGNADADGYGEILLRTPTLFRAYRDRPAPSVSGPDGTLHWFPTGDGGRLSESGKLEVTGRLADVIVTGGEKVYPIDVETVIRQMEGVSDVAVWKRPDPVWGERVVAWIAPNGDPPSLDTVRATVKENLSAFAAPKELEIVASIPRSALGKVNRYELS